MTSPRGKPRYPSLADMKVLVATVGAVAMGLGAAAGCGRSDDYDPTRQELVPPVLAHPDAGTSKPAGQDAATPGPDADDLFMGGAPAPWDAG